MSDNQNTEKSSGGIVVVVLLVIIAVAAGGLFYMSKTGMIAGVDSMAKPETKVAAEDMADEVMEVVEETAKTVLPEDGSEEQTESTEQASETQAPEEDVAAQEPVLAEGNPVVAVVYEEEIKRTDVMNFIGQLPEQLRALPVQTIFPMALDQLVTDKVIRKRVDEAGLSDDPEVQELVSKAEDQIVKTVYLERQIEKELTEDKLQAEYKKLVSDIESEKETHARHILVEDESTAKDLIAKLDGGADFAELAKENSTGPSATSGGDLGFFTEREMVPEFAEAAFSIAPGSYSKKPVKTQFGWHVIKVEERRDSPKPDFASVRPQIEQKLRQDTAMKLFADWKGQADVKQFDINGNPVAKTDAAE